MSINRDHVTIVNPDRNELSIAIIFFSVLLAQLKLFNCLLIDIRRD